MTEVKAEKKSKSDPGMLFIKSMAYTFLVMLLGTSAFLLYVYNHLEARKYEQLEEIKTVLQDVMQEME